MRLSVNGYRQEIQCQDFYRESYYFYFFAVAAINSLSFPAQISFKSMCKTRIIKQDLNMKNIFSH